LKPLYLHGPPTLEVVLDGPALRVQTESTAPRLFPLRRLSRVIVSGDVMWELPALLACAGNHGKNIVRGNGRRLIVRQYPGEVGETRIAWNQAAASYSGRCTESRDCQQIGIEVRTT